MTPYKKRFIPSSAEYKIKRNKVLTIILVWGLAGMVISIYDHFAFHSQFSAGTSLQYSFGKSLLLNTVVGIIAALLGGSFIVFVVNDKYRDSPYWKAVLLVVGSFIVVSSSLILLVSYIQSVIESGNAGPSVQVLLQDALHIKNVLIWSVILALTQFTLQISDKFGKGVLWNFILGRYHSPKEETRIFMLVDLISSTAIAEKLSKERYHLLLRDFFTDITDAIIYNKGEIYQYVGDEIVISWKLTSRGFNNHCLQCYFDMHKIILSLADKYKTKYGLVPDFKAGLHYGKVVAGEIGIIKRDITFSGDVLNTTSRIQNKCNEYKVKILSSDELLQLLLYSNLYQRIPIGDVELKGKENKVSLSTLKIIE